MAKIGIIIGTNRPARIGRGIAKWLQRTMQYDGLQIDLIDLAEINLPFLDEPKTADTQEYTQEHTRQWSQLIKGYDGFVLLFPQYNWGYPAVLKNALDFLYHEWNGKPVSLACYGGHGGFQGSLAMELVIQGLKMKKMTANLPLNIEDDMFDQNGQFKDLESSLAPNAYAAQEISAEFGHLLNKD